MRRRLRRSPASSPPRRAYNHPDNKLRASVLADPAGKRSNTRDNTPAVVNTKIVPGHHVEVIVAANPIQNQSVRLRVVSAHFVDPEGERLRA